MVLEKKKNHKKKARAISKNAIEQRNISPVIIPEQIFQSLLKHFDGVALEHRNVALTVKEYPVEEINDRIRKTRSDPTHLVLFCLRVIASNEYSILGVVHINKRFEHVDQLTLLWVAFIQDLSRLSLEVVASISPCTQMYRDILAQLTRNQNFENWSQPITYLVYPYSVLHLYDYNSIMEEFQDTFHFRKDLCFLSRHWADSASAEKVYAASWRILYGIIKPTLGKHSYHYADRAAVGDELIFMPSFRRNYKIALQNNPKRGFTRLSTDFLLDLLWEFSRISEDECMKLEEFEKFCVENQELKYMLASGHFKCSPYNEVQNDNVWFSRFESNSAGSKGCYHTEFDERVGGKGREAFQNYINRLADNEEFFFDVEFITSMNNESTILPKPVRAFEDSNKYKRNNGIDDTSNLMKNRTHGTNPCVPHSSNAKIPKKLTKTSASAQKKIENSNEDATGTSYGILQESDTKCNVHYLDHILKPSKEDIKNYLDTFGYSKESYNNLYAYEQALNDDSSKEIEDDSSEDKRRLYAPYKKRGKLPKIPNVEKNATEILSKIISNKTVMNPNHHVPVEPPRTGSSSSKKKGSTVSASEINVNKNSTEIKFGKLKNCQKSAIKEPNRKNHIQEDDVAKCLTKTKVSEDDQEIPISTFYKNALLECISRQSKDLYNFGKTVSEELLVKQQGNEVRVDFSRGGFQMSKDNIVDFNDTVSDCFPTSEEIVNVIKASTKIKSREFKSGQKRIEELAKKQNHKVATESARNSSKMPKDNNMNFKRVPYEEASGVTADKDATKDTDKIQVSGQKIASEGLVKKNHNHTVPVEASKIGLKGSKDSNLDFNKTFSDSRGEGKDDTVPEAIGFLIKPISDLKGDENAIEATIEIKNKKSVKVSENQKSSQMPNKAKPKSRILQYSTDHQSLEIDEGLPKNELPTLKDQIKNKSRVSANRGYSNTSSIDHAFMSSNEQLLSADQAVEIIKSKQKALENMGLDNCLPLLKPAQENKNGKKENLRPSFSGKRSKVFIRDDSCRDEIRPDFTKQQKTAYSYMLPELVKNCEIDEKESTSKKSNQNPEINISTELPSSAESKNAKQSDIRDNCQELAENEHLLYDLYTKDSMDNFFECFEPRRNKQLNKVLLSFLQNMSLSSPSYILESAIAYLDPVKEENICSEKVPETNNESPQQLAENDDIRVIGVEEYRQLLLSDCDKQKRTCDINNVKDIDVVIHFFNIVPESAEVLQITTDWLCTLKGYSKLVEKLRECNVPLVRTSALCLDHLDMFVDIIKDRNAYRLVGQAHKFNYKDLRFLMIDKEGTFEVIEREGRGSGRFEIIQDYSCSV